MRLSQFALHMSAKEHMCYTYNQYVDMEFPVTLLDSFTVHEQIRTFRLMKD